MDLAWFAGAIVGAVFLLSGAGKLASRTWPAQARALGAPRFAVPAVPWIELVLGAALVAGLGARWAALGALVLLLSFTALVIVRLAQGRRPPCACFGQWAARPIGPGTVARNVVLIGIAATAVVLA